jgi:hypothetical protein
MSFETMTYADDLAYRARFDDACEVPGTNWTDAVDVQALSAEWLTLANGPDDGCQRMLDISAALEAIYHDVVSDLPEWADADLIPHWETMTEGML